MRRDSAAQAPERQTSRPTISAVVNTLDEERRLPWALGSVKPWVGELIVVDMASTDHTVEVARALGARVFDHPQTGYVEPARAFACAQASCDWVLVLDADELVPEPLSRRLRAIAEEIVCGEPLLHSGWNPERDRHVRFWKRDAVDLSDRMHVHARPRAGRRCLDLPFADGEAIVHLSHPDLAACAPGSCAPPEHTWRGALHRLRSPA